MQARIDYLVSVGSLNGDDMKDEDTHKKQLAALEKKLEAAVAARRNPRENR